MSFNRNCFDSYLMWTLLSDTEVTNSPKPLIIDPSETDLSFFNFRRCGIQVMIFKAFAFNTSTTFLLKWNICSSSHLNQYIIFYMNVPIMWWNSLLRKTFLNKKKQYTIPSNYSDTGTPFSLKKTCIKHLRGTVKPNIHCKCVFIYCTY